MKKKNSFKERFKTLIEKKGFDSNKDYSKLKKKWVEAEEIAKKQSGNLKDSYGLVMHIFKKKMKSLKDEN